MPKPALPLPPVPPAFPRPAFPRPLFWTLQGTDFGRSIAWAKQQPANPVTAAMQRAAIECVGPNYLRRP